MRAMAPAPLLLTAFLTSGTPALALEPMPRANRLDAVLEAPPPAPPVPVAALTPEARQAGQFNRALAAAAGGHWAEARGFAAQTGAPVAEDVILWSRLREGIGTWVEYKDFLARNRDWPGLASLRRAGEHLMPPGLSPGEVGRYFLAGLPQTGTGSLRLAEAFTETGRQPAAEKVILRAWLELPMSAPERAAIRAEYGDLVASHTVERLDMLLWNGYMREAETMLADVPPEWAALAKARIATRRDSEGLQLLIWAVPAKLRNDPGLAYERYLYRVNKGRWDEAEEMLYENSASEQSLGRPDFWMERRAGLARQALRRGDFARAYRLAANNFGTGGADYAEAEWLAGYIALTEMNDASLAAQHFEHFRESVSTPISLGRAGYWLGLALERSGQPEAAAQAYRLGAMHQTSFYGQLAAERAGLPADSSITGNDGPDPADAPDLAASSVVQAAELFISAGQDGRAAQFLRHAAETRPPAGRAALAQMAIDAGLTHVGVRIAKDAAREGVILPAQYYPLPDLERGAWPVPPEFALAIARQESELNAAAASPAGARGLMQLMPATAQHVARQIGLPYSETRLVRDPVYNARLGTAYLQRMLDRYDGSYLLATAAYNAGPGRVDAWLQTFGDPRSKGTDVILWIESIPFNETRNYVMRVLESLHVYRARLEGRAGPIRLAAEMNRTG